MESAETDAAMGVQEEEKPLKWYSYIEQTKGCSITWNQQREEFVCYDSDSIGIRMNKKGEIALSWINLEDGEFYYIPSQFLSLAAQLATSDEIEPPTVNNEVY